LRTRQTQQFAQAAQSPVAAEHSPTCPNPRRVTSRGCESATRMTAANVSHNGASACLCAPSAVSLRNAKVRILPPQPASPVSIASQMKVAQNRAVPRHFADMTRSPCAEMGHGSIISGPCLRGPFLVSRFSRNVEVALGMQPRPPDDLSRSAAENRNPFVCVLEQLPHGLVAGATMHFKADFIGLGPQGTRIVLAVSISPPNA
jgi:hypothetical protein